MASETREPAVVEYVRSDDERGSTHFVGMHMGGCHQGFGGLCLDEVTRADWIRSIADLFGVDDIEKVVGRNCFVLRSWPRWGSNIEGLEVDGRRFTITGFRKKHWPDKTKSPLLDEQDRIQRDIDWHGRRVQEQIRALQTLEDGYVDWESESL